VGFDLGDMHAISITARNQFPNTVPQILMVIKRRIEVNFLGLKNQL
jgi:hypothetical protein